MRSTPVEAPRQGETEPEAAGKIATTKDLVSTIVRYSRSPEVGPPRPLFTVLVGAGVSQEAGMPSTRTVVRALKARAAIEVDDRNPLPWRALLDQSEELADTPTNEEERKDYRDLFADVCSDPLQRRSFIGEAINWAKRRAPGIAPVSFHLASLLLAGSRKQRIRDPDGLGGWFADTVYTTNFDDVIRDAIRTCGEDPRVISKTADHGALHGDADDPRIVQLHGHHTEYSIRNTPEELATKEQAASLDVPGLFARFRDALRRTGLVILGYSGADPLVMEVIENAVNDHPNSLQHKVFWGAYHGELSLSPEALALVKKKPNVIRLFEIGRPAGRTLHDLCGALETPNRTMRQQWAASARAALEQHQHALKKRNRSGATGFKQLTRLLLDAELVDEGNWLMQRPNRGNEDRRRAKEWLDRVEQAFGAMESADDDASVELLLKLADVHEFVSDAQTTARALRRAYRQQVRRGGSEASARMRVADRLMSLNEPGEAEAIATEEAERFLSNNDKDGYIHATSIAIAAALIRSRVREAKALAAAARAHLPDARRPARARLYEQLANVSRRCNELDDSERDAGRALEEYPTEEGSSRSTVLSLLADIARRRRELGAAERRYAEAAKLGGRYAKADAALGLARGFIEAGDGNKAREQLSRASRLARKLEVRGQSPSLAYEIAELSARLAVGNPRAHLHDAEKSRETLLSQGSLYLALQAQISIAHIEACASLADARKTARTARVTAEEHGELLAVVDAEAALARTAASRRRTR